MPETLLAKKLRRGGVARSPLPDTELIGETFARFIEDALRPLLKTTVSAMLLESRVVRLSEALEDVSVPALLGLIEIEECDTSGLIGIDTDLAFHLIDLSLGGDPEQAPVPTARTFTAIDFGIGRLHQEALLDAFRRAIALILNRPVGKGMAIGGQQQNVSQVRIAPGYVDTLLFTIALDIGEAARTGNAKLILPLATLDAIRTAVQTAATDRHRPDDLWRVAMKNAAASARVPLVAVLDRRKLTLGEIEALRPGDVLPLPDGAVASVDVTIAQPGGKTAVIATARVGGYRGSKVIKLTCDPDPRLARHVEDALG
jgi:flagellar motor switch protein FliM